MRKEDKNKIIDDLVQRISEYKHFYLTDIGSLNAKDTSDLRRLCFEKDIKLMVVKNTMLQKALERSGHSYEEIYPALKNSTSVMFTHSGNAPAKLIKEFRKTHAKPLLKGAYVEESVYLGEEQLDALFNLKSRDELIGDIILLLQSPMNNVMGALKSGNNILTGVLKTLEEKK
jgi:large subunit ribosomal protein L10